ncbi:MAG: SCO family protein [Verrucomicrobia bacterium]|nr:SCO family protein [Verrucomicrobiota bacterium]
MRFFSRLRDHHLSCALLFAVAVAISSTATTAGGATDSPFPAPGTYKLDRIEPMANGWVIESSAWRPRRLSSYTSGKVTLFSFFYGTCRDPTGCPATWAAFEDIQSSLQKDKDLNGRVRLLFLSLDPNVDTPDLLSFYTVKSTPQVPWHFLTTWSEWFLRPIMQSLSLTTSYALDKNGQRTGEIYHMVRVYLIDRDGWIREIYATGFFDPDVVVNDIKTLVMEENEKPK